MTTDSEMRRVIKRLHDGTPSAIDVCIRIMVPDHLETLLSLDRAGVRGEELVSLFSECDSNPETLRHLIKTKTTKQLYAMARHQETRRKSCT